MQPRKTGWNWRGAARQVRGEKWSDEGRTPGETPGETSGVTPTGEVVMGRYIWDMFNDCIAWWDTDWFKEWERLAYGH